MGDLLEAGDHAQVEVLPQPDEPRSAIDLAVAEIEVQRLDRDEGAAARAVDLVEVVEAQAGHRHILAARWGRAGLPRLEGHHQAGVDRRRAPCRVARQPRDGVLALSAEPPRRRPPCA